MILSDKKIWWLEWVSDYDGDRAHFVGADAIRLDGKRKIHATTIDELFETMTNEGASFVFVYDMSYFGMFCDLYAARKGMTEFRKAKKQKGRKGCAEPCFSVLYAGSQGVLNFRLTLARTRYTHDFRGGKLGGLHTVEYRGMDGFLHESTRGMLEETFGGKAETALERGRLLLKGFASKMTEITGEEFFDVQYLRNVYTVGGAARRLYLSMRYGKGKARLSSYQKEHDADEEFEDYFRARRLLLGGMCFYTKSRAGKLYEKPLRKYDVNGLYSSTAEMCGELSYPRRATGLQMQTDHDPNHVYIVVLRDLYCIRKDDMPPCFDNPFAVEEYSHEDGEIINIQGEIAMFRDLFFELHQYYIFDSFELVDVFVMERKADPYLYDYDKKILSIKEKATLDEDHVLRELAKLFANALFGKFSQNTKYIELIPKYNAELDIIEFARGNLIDNWERGHFDFIRGAYIYTMARVRMMTDIRRLCEKYGAVKDYHYYTDTDSIVTDVEMPQEWIDPVIGGRYKIEREYSAFGILSKKVYYARLKDGSDELIAAGVQRGLVIREIHERYGDDLTAAQTWDIIRSGAAYTVRYATRVSGGGAVGDFELRLHEINVEKDFRRI